MASQLQESFQEINAVLMGVINIALAYLLHHDECFKKHCLTTSAWAGVRELEGLSPSLPEPFLTLVKTCLGECAEARKQMPEPNAAHEKYPAAAASLARLAAELDKLLESDPTLGDGIDEKDFASQKMFENLAAIASRME